MNTLFFISMNEARAMTFGCDYALPKNVHEEVGQNHEIFLLDNTFPKSVVVHHFLSSKKGTTGKAFFD